MKAKKDKKGKLINKKRLIAVLILLVLSVVMLLSNPEVRNYLFGEEAVKITFPSGVEYKAIVYEDLMLLVSRDGIRAVDDRGEDEWSIVFSMSSPMTVVKDDYIMVADAKGKTANVYSEEKLLYQVKTQSDILTATINDDGYLAVATDELGYKGAVTVFDSKGKELFKWHSGSGYIGDIDLSSDNVLAVSQIMADRDSVYTRVLYVDTERESEARCIGEVDGLVMDVGFNDDEELLAVSENSMCCYDDEGIKQYVIDFKGRTPVDCNIENSDNLVFAFDGGLNNTVLESYSENGKIRGRYETDSQIRNFDVNGEYILYATIGKVYRISPEGELQNEVTTSVDAKDLKVFSDRDNFLLLGGSGAEILKID